MEKVKIEKKTVNLFAKIAVVVVFLLLVWLLIYALIYYPEKNCNVELEFEKIDGCSDEKCKVNCAAEGFEVSLNHTFAGTKKIAYNFNNEVIRDVVCSCKCFGCRNN